MKFLVVLLTSVLGLGMASVDWSKVSPMPDRTPVAIPKSLKHNAHNRIVGGNEAKPNSLPFQAALYISRNNNVYFCGGSLISSKYVLTAAHCVDGASSVKVILGAHNIKITNEPTQVTQTSTVLKPHKQYNPKTLVNDIAMIELPNEVAFTNAIQPVKLPSKSDVDNDFVGERARVSGWGKTSDGSGSISNVLMYVDITVIENKSCNESYFGAVHESNVCCNGADGKSSCNGDSGGPLVIQDQQIGLVSFGVIFGCEVGWPSAYTRLTSFLPWIELNSNVVIEE